jgi:hypothetical protein
MEEMSVGNLFPFSLLAHCLLIQLLLETQMFENFGRNSKKSPKGKSTHTLLCHAVPFSWNKLSNFLSVMIIKEPDLSSFEKLWTKSCDK